MKKNIFAFTLIELIVVITIISILSAIWFINYTSTVWQSRNAARISDMGNLKITLKNHKLINGNYPMPWKKIDITNSGVIIYQWLMNNEVYSTEITNKPTDPYLKKQFYSYSVTKNKLFFQIAMSMENERDFAFALVDGDYQQINRDIPWLIFATNTGWSIQTLSGKVILNGSYYNFPYNKTWQPVFWNVNLTALINEVGQNLSQYCGYLSCKEIYENGMSMWSGTYCMLDATGSLISSGCTMNY